MAAAMCPVSKVEDHEGEGDQEDKGATAVTCRKPASLQRAVRRYSTIGSWHTLKYACAHDTISCGTGT